MIIFGPGDVFAGRFRLEQRIGQGGMGQVWRARQLGLDREVAIKFLHPTAHDDVRFRQMFLAEAQISARLNHPNIVPVVDFGEHEGEILWLVQIFVDGQDLGDLLSRAPKGLPVPLAGYIVSQVLLGLHCAHENHVIHRDLKPRNVLISRGGDVQITDFGIAKVLQEGQTPTFTTMKGSPGYLAPEILRGDPPRFASDLFSVGGLLYELLTGSNPFIKSDHADRDQIFRATLNDEVPRLAECGVSALPGLDELVARLLAKDPDRRYGAVGEALEDLLTVLAPVAREASPMALRKFLAVSSDTVVPRGPRSVSSPSGPAISSLAVSGMSGQLSPDVRRATGGTRRRGRRRALAVATALLALTTAIVAVVVSRSRREEASAVVPVAPAVTAADAAPSTRPPALTITVEPRDATLEIDGHRLSGTSPYVIDRRPGAVLRLHAARDGYATVDRELTVGTEDTVKIELEALPDAGARVPEAAPSPSTAPRKRRQKPPDKEDVLPI